MSLLTWIPKDLRDRLWAADPERDAIASPPPDLEDVVAAEADDVLPAPDRPRRRASLLAPIAAAAVVVVAVAVGVVIGTRGEGSNHPATNDRPSSAADRAAQRWSTFPVHARPRPIVLIDESVQGPKSGFSDDATKLAFIEGHFRLGTALPTSPATRDGYPVIRAGTAIAQLAAHPTAGPQTTVALTVSSIRLITHLYLTDRGTRSLPAWQIHLDGVRDDVYVLAVAPSAHYPHTLAGSSAGVATASDDGRELTIWFIAHKAPSLCEAGYTTTLAAAQTSSAIAFAATQHDEPPLTAPSRVFCAQPLITLRQDRPPKPGGADTRTIQLSAPLGARVVVNGHGIPYQIVTG